jgi:magnesium transporter
VSEIIKGPKDVGLSPGTLVHVGEKKIKETKISIVDYNEAQIQEMDVKTAEECFPYKDKPTVTWIKIDGLHEIEVIEKIGRHFGLHPLVLEDVLNTRQRPKIEDFEDYIVIILKTFMLGKKDTLDSEQISIVLGPNFVLSFLSR